jgi:tRNA pseudouridine38-40 synthase
MNERLPDVSNRKIALLTEYDGSAFNGWQAQAKGRTVQQTMEQALRELTGEDHPVLIGSSRTDAGVHARGHVSHFKTGSRIPCDRLPLAMNSVLPPDISVLAACQVPPEFHAQHQATGKIYTYRYWPQKCRPALDRRQTCHVTGPFDLAAMREALPCLAGRHDFTAFMDTGSCERQPVRNLQKLELTEDGTEVVLTVCGDGFLYHMVRIIAGTLLLVAQRKIQPGSLTAILNGRDRKAAGKTMPAQGLCLEQVFYDPPLFTGCLPGRPALSAPLCEGVVVHA